jgi:hypothetical protein
MKRIVFIVVTASTVAGCATMSPQQAAAWQQQMAATQPHCTSQRQCEAAWSAARNWVTSNCGMKIQSITDNFIQTYNSPESSVDLQCEVTKDPDPKGGYTLSIADGCANPFGCATDAHAAALDFNKQVSATIAQFAGQ